MYHWNWDLRASGRGYRMGFYASSGVNVSHLVIRTLEGDLQQGYSTVSGPTINEDCVQELEEDLSDDVPDSRDRMGERSLRTSQCQVSTNPWQFSSLNTDMQSKLSKLTSKPVLIYYVSYHYKFFTNSYDIAHGVWPVDPNIPLPYRSLDREDHYFFSQSIHKFKGVKEGHVVRAAVVGNIRQHYEIDLQVGLSGNNFMRMNIETADLYDFVVRCMATGHYLRIYYIQLYNKQNWPAKHILGYHTKYRVYRIDVLDK